MKKNLFQKVLVYSVISYIITWSIAFLIYFSNKKNDLSDYQINFYHSFASIGPAIGAIITTLLFYGKQGIKEFLSKIKFPGLDKKTVIILVSPLVLFISANFIYFLIKSEWYNFSNYASMNFLGVKTFLAWLLPLFTYSIFEEVGWRGFLLPHLQEKFNPFKATVILAFIWALWHIPFFFYRFDFTIGISIGFFFGIFIGSTILTFIYNSNKSFLIPVMLFHFLNNICSSFDKEIFVVVLNIGFIFIAINIFIKWRKDNKLNITNKYKIKN